MMTDAQALGIMAAILQAGDRTKNWGPQDYVADARELFAVVTRLHVAETAAPRRHSNFSVGEPEEVDGA